MSPSPAEANGRGPLSVAMIASEVVPLAKTGGLADVAGALPQALARAGHGAAVFVPCYRSIRESAALEPTGVEVDIPLGPTIVSGRILRTTLPGGAVPVFAIDRPELFDRPGLYGEEGRDYWDNCARFVFFARATLEAIRQLGLKFDVLHCNDWQAGLIPAYLEEFYRPNGGWDRVGTLMTIHNMAYQGIFWHYDMPLTGLPWDLFHWKKLEFYGKLNFLKAGLVYADLLSTVSPTYAREIQTPEYGCGLDGLLRGRSGDLRGVANGIDATAWNPALDDQIAANYGPSTFREGKAACKSSLQRRSSLPERPDVPLLAAVGRLDPQKGWDLLVPALSELLSQRDVQVVILGEGQRHYHEQLDHLAARHPDRFRAFLHFSGPLAHQIEAGADIFLMPSLYEPCGLNQMYSQAYGTVPVVRSTGGLADTVVAANAQTLADGTATGFAFRDPDVAGLRWAIDSALAAYHDPEGWARIVRAGMAKDWSWDASARAYVEIYREIRARRQARIPGPITP